MQIQAIRFDEATIRLNFLILEIIFGVVLFLWAIYYWKHRAEFQVKRELRYQQFAKINAEIKEWKLKHPIIYWTVLTFQCFVYVLLFFEFIWLCINGGFLKLVGEP